MNDAALMARHRAALKLVEAGEVKPWQALLFVVAPPPEVEEIAGRFRSNGQQVVGSERREKALAMVRAGASCREAAEAIGVARSTVTSWTWRERARRLGPGSAAGHLDP